MLFLVTLPGPAWAGSLNEALAQAAKTLKSSRLAGHPEKAIIIQVVNRHSQKSDVTAKGIESELYIALEKAFPTFKLVFLDESLAGVNLLKAIVIKGAYEQKGPITELKLRALDGLQGSVMGQVSVTFDSLKTTRKNLVAVLDIAAKQLSEEERSFLSDIFREALGNKKVFELASSADVAKMNADAIQKTYGCTRDECATMIGEQMGVDKVISTTLMKMGGQIMLSSKIMNIQDGSIEKTATIRFKGQIEDLEKPLQALATKLTGVEGVAKTAAQGYGQLVISSTPDQATLYLDGEKLGDKTKASLPGIPAGDHELKVIKGNLGAVVRFTLKKDAVKRFDLTLKEEAPLKIETRPIDAEIFLDGERIGKAPLLVTAKTGSRKLKVVFPDGATFLHNMRVSLEDTNEVSFKEANLAQATVKISPADAELWVSGKSVGAAPSTPYSKDHSREVVLALPMGTYQLKLSHPDQTKPISLDVDLRVGVENAINLKVPLKAGYVRWQDYHQEKAWRSTKITWGWSIAAVFAGYGYSESQKADKALAAQKKAETARDQAWAQYKTAVDLGRSQANFSEVKKQIALATAEENQVKIHNAKMQSADVATTLALLAVTWFWLDDPNEPPAYSFAPVLSPQGQLGLRYSKRW